MKLIKEPLSKQEILLLKSNCGNYLKLTVDVNQEILVAGCELHADGEAILLKKSSQQKNIWGGGIDLENKIIDTMAVLNLRPNLNNDSMEILDPEIRERFIKMVKKVFAELWS